MKKASLIKAIAIFAFVMTIAQFAQAQTKFKCNKCTICWYDDNNDEIDGCEERKESSLFVIDDDLTTITHTTGTTKNTYYITDADYDEQENIFTFEATDADGGEYLFFVSPDEKKIAVSFEDEVEDSWLILFDIKEIY